ncbi:MAG: T3SS effector HopA1 family protein, partial [Candidatus Bathyarchaeota archaeon]|nr:T3SS effector HopA1 family protein [Candidatus Bathyarchaeota archaeon]
VRRTALKYYEGLDEDEVNALLDNPPPENKDLREVLRQAGIEWPEEEVEVEDVLRTPDGRNQASTIVPFSQQPFPVAGDDSRRSPRGMSTGQARDAADNLRADLANEELGLSDDTKGDLDDLRKALDRALKGSDSSREFFVDDLPGYLEAAATPIDRSREDSILDDPNNRAKLDPISARKQRLENMLRQISSMDEDDFKGVSYTKTEALEQAQRDLDYINRNEQNLRAALDEAENVVRRKLDSLRNPENSLLIDYLMENVGLIRSESMADKIEMGKRMAANDIDERYVPNRDGFEAMVKVARFLELAGDIAEKNQTYKRGTYTQLRQRINDLFSGNYDEDIVNTRKQLKMARDDVDKLRLKQRLENLQRAARLQAPAAQMYNKLPDISAKILTRAYPDREERLKKYYDEILWGDDKRLTDPVFVKDPMDGSWSQTEPYVRIDGTKGLDENGSIPMSEAEDFWSAKQRFMDKHNNAPTPRQLREFANLIEESAVGINGIPDSKSPGYAKSLVGRARALRDQARVLEGIQKIEGPDTSFNRRIDDHNLEIDHPELQGEKAESPLMNAVRGAVDGRVHNKLGEGSPTSPEALRRRGRDDDFLAGRVVMGGGKVEPTNRFALVDRENPIQVEGQFDVNGELVGEAGDFFEAGALMVDVPEQPNRVYAVNAQKQAEFNSLGDALNQVEDPEKRNTIYMPLGNALYDPNMDEDDIKEYIANEASGSTRNSDENANDYLSVNPEDLQRVEADGVEDAIAAIKADGDMAFIGRVNGDYYVGKAEVRSMKWDPEKAVSDSSERRKQQIAQLSDKVDSVVARSEKLHQDLDPVDALATVNEMFRDLLRDVDSFSAISRFQSDEDEKAFKAALKDVRKKINRSKKKATGPIERDLFGSGAEETTPETTSASNNVQFSPGADIFDEKFQDAVLVNPVNVDKRIAGQRRAAGLANQFKDRFPANFEAYSKAVEEGRFQEGQLFGAEENGQLILNFPTKGSDVRKPADVGLIKDGLDKLVEFANRNNLKEIVLPRLGGGFGRLDFDKDVLPLILDAASKMPNTSVRILSNKPDGLDFEDHGDVEDDGFVNFERTVGTKNPTKVHRASEDKKQAPEARPVEHTEDNNFRSTAALKTGGYLPTSEGRGVMIDAVHPSAGVTDSDAYANNDVRDILLTHADKDHIEGLPAAAQKIFDDTGEKARVFIHEAEADNLRNSQWFDENTMELVPLKDGDMIDAGGMQFLVHHAPGHSPGSVVFSTKDSNSGRVRIYAGDALKESGLPYYTNPQDKRFGKPSRQRNELGLPAGSQEDYGKTLDELLGKGIFPPDALVYDGHSQNQGYEIQNLKDNKDLKQHYGDQLMNYASSLDPMSEPNAAGTEGSQTLEVFRPTGDGGVRPALLGVEQLGERGPAAEETNDTEPIIREDGAIIPSPGRGTVEEVETGKLVVRNEDGDVVGSLVYSTTNGAYDSMFEANGGSGKVPTPDVTDGEPSDTTGPYYHDYGAGDEAIQIHHAEIDENFRGQGYGRALYEHIAQKNLPVFRKFKNAELARRQEKYKKELVGTGDPKLDAMAEGDSPVNDHMLERFDQNEVNRALDRMFANYPMEEAVWRAKEDPTFWRKLYDDVYGAIEEPKPEPSASQPFLGNSPEMRELREQHKAEGGWVRATDRGHWYRLYDKEMKGFGLGQDPDVDLQRLYINVNAEGAPALFKAVAEALDEEELPFQIKAPNDPDDYNRTDAAILYIDRKNMDKALEVVKNFTEQNPDAVSEGSLLFGRRAGRGLALADEPDKDKFAQIFGPDPEISFGKFMTGIMQDVLKNSEEDDSPEDVLRRLRARFEELGLDPDRPWLRDAAIGESARAEAEETLSMFDAMSNDNIGRVQRGMQAMDTDFSVDEDEAKAAADAVSERRNKTRGVPDGLARHGAFSVLDAWAQQIKERNIPFDRERFKGLIGDVLVGRVDEDGKFVTGRGTMANGEPYPPYSRQSIFAKIRDGKYDKLIEDMADYLQLRVNGGLTREEEIDIRSELRNTGAVTG